MTIGRVYSIRSHTRPELVYYGSTKETLCRRMSGHRSAYKQFLAGKAKNMTSFRLLEIGDAKIELVELVEFTEKSQLVAVEGRYIRENECVNKRIEGRTPAQYHIDNREHFKEIRAAYYAANKDTMLAQNKVWEAENVERRKATHVLWTEANIERLRTRNECLCGGHYNTRDK